MEATRYPVDYEALNKGDVLSQEQLEKITDERAGTPHFQLKVLALRAKIETAKEDMGEPVVLASHGNTLCVLTDREASERLNRHRKRAVRWLHRTVKRFVGVDVSDFSEDEVYAHNRRVEIAAKTLGGAVMGQGEAIKALPHKRSTPLLTQE